MIQVEEHVDIRKHCTLGVGGQFRYFTAVQSLSDLSEAQVFASSKGLPLFILGSGSNLVFSDGVLEVVTLKNEIKGFEIMNETDEHVDIRAGAGENWDAFVGRTVEMNLSGVEALSAIPGTVGATPVQNVGAYGQEVKDTIVEVEVFDIKEGTIKTLSNAECAFSYRDSIFKHDAKGRYVIVAVTFRLSKALPTIPNYPGVKKYFDESGVATPTLLQIREAVIEIRKTKLPNPKEIPNVGSFFKNPIVESDVAAKLKEQNPSITIFTVDDTHSKIPAGWLIENAGLKGKDFGTMRVYENNALVLVNNGTATFADVGSVRDEIIKTVKERFGIVLETEPQFV